MKKVISTEQIPIKLWLDDIEDGALEQAKNLANLPFAFKHIAIMPDSHQGFGMPIGGVMATKGVIVPNAVGCFTGDTKIPLLEGTQRTLEQLHKTGGTHYVYSLNKDLKLVPGKAKAKLTRKNANLVEIVISGGEVIRCTPDHQFMLLDGSYKEAKDLKRFDSLMPLYRGYQSRDGYERIRTKSGNGIITHKMVAEYFLGEKKDTDIIHHKDENWFNNSPKNLEYKDVNIHSSEHAIKKGNFKTKEFQRKKMETIRKRGYYWDKKFDKMKKEVATKNMTTYMKNNYDEWKEKIKDNGKRGAKYLIKYNKSKKGRLKSSEMGKKYGFGKKANNHKVLFINKLIYTEDVYCLTVEKYHNFALSAGIFVHNCDIGCGMVAIKTSLTDIDTDTLKKIMGEIRKVIPVGFEHHNENSSEYKQNLKIADEILDKHYEIE